MEKGLGCLGPERKEVICYISRPENERQLREFLDAAGFCQTWRPRFAKKAKPPHDILAGKENEKELLNWPLGQTEFFQTIKRTLSSALALGIPDVTRAFNLFVDEWRHVASGISL